MVYFTFLSMKILMVENISNLFEKEIPRVTIIFTKKMSVQRIGRRVVVTGCGIVSPIGYLLDLPFCVFLI